MVVVFLAIGLLLNLFFSLPEIGYGHCPQGSVCSERDLNDEAYMYNIYHCLRPTEKNTGGVWSLASVENTCGDAVGQVYIDKFTSNHYSEVLENIRHAVAAQRAQISPDEMQAKQQKLYDFIYERNLPTIHAYYLAMLAIVGGLIAYFSLLLVRRVKSKKSNPQN
jgi:hypothetical protein